MKAPFKQIIQDQKWYLLPFLLIWLTGFVLMITHPKGWFVLLINGMHQPWLDKGFALITKGGEEWAGIALGVFLIITASRKYLVAFLGAVLVMVAITQILKHHVYPDALRPIAWFNNAHPNLHQVSGVKIHLKHSFPSGHTTAGFLFFGFWAMLLKDRFWKLFFLGSAVLVGFSRMYLLQHFLEDVLAGSILGTLLALFALFASRSFFPSTPYWNRKWTRSSDT